MSRREELLELDEDLNARKRELFSQEYMTTKQALLRRIDDVVRRTEGQVSRSPEEDLEGRRYFEAKLGNLREFRDCVRETTLLEVLDEGWCYEFAIDSHGTSLLLRHVSLAEIADNGHDEWLEVEEYDSRLEVIETRCRLLSVDEFASERGVAPATIRVWIRRGKIRSAMKTASGWMVPEMAAPLRRGFTDAEYAWDVNLGDCTEGLEGLCEPGSVLIRKSREKGKRTVWYANADHTQGMEFELGISEAERLELFLIGHPAVEYTGDREVIHQ
jgi:hypothetical protein